MAGAGNAINEGTTGICGFTGTAFTGTAATQYNVIVGGSTSSTLSNVAPSATSGVPVISQGSSANPVFGTAVVAGGGTGVASTTAYAVLCGGTSSTAALQSIASVGSSGQVLVSNGAGALPTFQSISATNAFDQVIIQVFTSTGTYTPTTGMKYCTIELVGGGGGGGGGSTTGAATLSGGGGGGGGGYARKTVTAATIGASQAVTVGAAGTAGALGGGTGGNGGTTSVGAIVSATGGTGAAGSGAGIFWANNAGASGVGSSGDINIQGGIGIVGFGTMAFAAAGYCVGGQGGSSYFGGGGIGFYNSTVPGAAGGNYGGGGAGATIITNGTQQLGGAGAKGVVIITEYVST